jgi:16S rRNA (cytosine967-C5)-methyltransferase
MGVIRRNPDSKWNLSKKNLNRFNKRQVRFLCTVSSLLKNGGVLVYAVCSTEPEENEGVIESFLHKHPEFEICESTDPSVEILDPLRTSKGYFISFPHIHGMDGFFIACLKRKQS